MAKTGPKRSSLERVDHKRSIARLYKTGWGQMEIARELGISQSQVSRDMAALRKEWLESALVDVDESRAKELAKLDHLESEYWRAWERSQEEAETFTDADKARGGGYTYKIERRDGNPAFLSGVMDCIRKRCDILGVGAPKEQDIGDKGSKDLFEGRTAIEELRVRLTRIAERSLAAQHPEPN